MLYGYHVPCFGGISAQYDRAVEGSQNAFTGIGGNVGAEVLLFGIELGRNHTTGGAVEDQSVGFGVSGDVGQVVLFGLFILFAEVGFALGAFHQRVLAENGQ